MSSCIIYHLIPPTSHLQPLDAGIIKAMKAWYWKSQLKCLIQLIELDKKPDVTLREALCYISVAWNSLSPSTISNCWRHTGIIAKSLETEESHTTLDTELEALLLQSDTFRSADCVSAAEYLEVDRVVETGETFTDDEIVALVGGRHCRRK